MRQATLGAILILLTLLTGCIDKHCGEAYAKALTCERFETVWLMCGRDGISGSSAFIGFCEDEPEPPCDPEVEVCEEEAK